ncbi:MAG: hypothetical protein PSX71_01760 [bacterium]|nr:hypothetical protein [bacterium]
MGGDAWDRAKKERRLGWRNVTLLPVGTQPSDFDWSFVAGASVLVIELEDTSPELRHAIVHTLAVYGARDAYLIPASRASADCVLWNCGPARKEAA